MVWNSKKNFLASPMSELQEYLEVVHKVEECKKNLKQLQSEASSLESKVKEWLFTQPAQKYDLPRANPESIPFSLVVIKQTKNASVNKTLLQDKIKLFFYHRFGQFMKPRDIEQQSNDLVQCIWNGRLKTHATKVELKKTKVPLPEKHTPTLTPSAEERDLKSTPLSSPSSHSVSTSFRSQPQKRARVSPPQLHELDPGEPSDEASEASDSNE